MAKKNEALAEWEAAQKGLNPDETEASRTLDNIAAKRAGWHRVRGRYPEGSGSPENEFGFAFFPSVPTYPVGSKEQKALEDEWEARSVAMHEAQRPIHLDAKSAENSLAARAERLRRGD